MEPGDNATLAGLIAAGIGALRALEALGTWAVRRVKNGKNGARNGALVVQLDPEVSRMLRETHERTRDVHEVTSVRDQNGTPMVFSPRSTQESVEKIADCVRDVSKSQERLGRGLDRLDEKVDAILKTVDR